MEEGPHALGRVSGRDGCAGVNVIGRGGPWQGGLPGSTKHRMVKPCSLGVHPRACRRSLNGTPTTRAFVSNHEDRRVRPTSRTVYIPTLDALSPGSLSFHPELFRGKDEPCHLTTSTRTSHTSASVYSFIQGVGGGLGRRETHHEGETVEAG